MDPDYVGDELGTKEQPFNTIAEGIGATARGGAVVLAAGTYSERAGIYVPRVISIRGAGADSTIISDYFIVSAPADTQAVVFKHLSCVGATFDLNMRGGAWLDASSAAEAAERLGRDNEYAPIEVDSCSVDSVRVGYPVDHSYTIENSDIGSVNFSHGFSSDVVHVVSNCEIEGGIRFAHGGATSGTTTIESCTIGGTVWIGCGAGHTFTIADNTLHGLDDRSGACETTISGNNFPSGDLIDKSGGWNTESQIIEWNQIHSGVIVLDSGSATCRYNTVNAPADTFGIQANCGPPSNIVGNTVTLPYQVLVGADPGSWTGVGIRASCGAGVIQGNNVMGGALGILDVSGTTEVSGNTVTGAHVGMYAAYANGKDYIDNSVSDCVSDGMVVASSFTPEGYGVFEGNSITSNGGAGIRMLYPADLGGGAQGSLGGNILSDNADHDLYVEVAEDSAAVIYAQHNTWDHSTAGEIDAEDVYDKHDDESLSDVEFLPLGSGGGAW